VLRHRPLAAQRATVLIFREADNSFGVLMGGLLRSLWQRADQWSERFFLKADIALAGFVLFSHGGALAVALAKPERAPDGVLPMAMLSLPLALAILASGIAALARPQLTSRVLAMHGLVLGAGALAMVIWACSVLISGPSPGNFVWTVGILTLLVGYAAYTMVRFNPLARGSSRNSVSVTVVFALALDVAVLVRVMSAVD